MTLPTLDAAQGLKVPMGLVKLIGYALLVLGAGRYVERRFEQLDRIELRVCRIEAVTTHQPDVACPAPGAATAAASLIGGRTP